MNKTAIKNFAIWARNKLIAEITYKAGLLGITEKEIKSPLPQSSKDVQFFDIGTRDPYSITGVEIEQRAKLAEVIQQKKEQSDYKTAFKNVLEEVAYTWFNRLIAVRFMEVNGYLPSRIRVLSSESSTKVEPDLVTTPFDADLEYTPYEKDRIMQMKDDNKLDELFRMLFIKQCNALNAILPGLFEKTNDYTELLLNVSFTDKDGVVYHLVHDIPEDDFNVEKEGQVEIIGWLYQYYNTEPKDETFDLLKKNVKISKERIPAATQLFTPDWIVRYMVENSLGRLWIEGHPNDDLKACWKYYLDEAKQEQEVQLHLDAIREEYKAIKPEDIKVIDPCMGSGHILVYAFDVLMQIYESYGYSQRDAAKSIVENNLYGLDIDNRAYQLAYFAVMMKARQYNRRILNGEMTCHFYAIQESNGINRMQLKYFGYGMSDLERNIAKNQMEYLLDTMRDLKEYGSIINVDNLNWDLLNSFVDNIDFRGQISFDTIGINSNIRILLKQLVELASVMAQKYDVVVTNPPYMGSGGMSPKLTEYVKANYTNSKSDLFSVFIEKSLDLTRKRGLCSLITMQSWMFLSTFEKLREIVLSQGIKNLVQIGYNSFPELNSKIAQAVAFVISKDNIIQYKGKFLDLTNKYPQSANKEEAFWREKKFGYYCVNSEKFHHIPGKPISYSIGEKLLNGFCNPKISENNKAILGLSTHDDERFLRMWFEVDWTKKYGGQQDIKICKWFPYNKGGNFRKWYGNNIYVVNYEDDGVELRQFDKASLSGKDYYFIPGITWTRVSTSKFAPRYYEEGYIIGDAGPSVITNTNNILYMLGFLSTSICNKMLSILNPTINYQAGNIGDLPLIIEKSKYQDVNVIVKNSVDISKNDWNSSESSWDFTIHPLLAYRTETSKIEDAYNNWSQFTEKQFANLKSNEEEINRIFIDIYGVQDEITSEVEDKDITIRKADLHRDIRSFISYAVGCMFGRYSLDVEGLAYGGGEWENSKYSTYIPDKDNILPITDEEYFEDDIVGLFCAFVKKTFGAETLEENLDFIANASGIKGNTSRETIRNYFLKEFYKDHCKVYQKRPIYWLFDSGKADGFMALVYMHRYNADTIGNLRIDYLHRMQRVYDSEIGRMQETIDNSGNAREVAAATKRKEKLIKQLKETKEYDEKIAHLALARISIDLDDGVKVNYEKVQTGIDGMKLEVLAKI